MVTGRLFQCSKANPLSPGITVDNIVTEKIIYYRGKILIYRRRCPSMSLTPEVIKIKIFRYPIYSS